jgi:hypothetical protein
MYSKSPSEVQTCEGPCTTYVAWTIGFLRRHALVALVDDGWAIHLASAGEMERGVQGWVMREKGTSAMKVRVGGKR